MAYNEVTVTRRVFRDGGSEYFINKTPCRLKDIQQLFMGTGVGRTSYSIMAQGNITQILSSKPEDRRMIFEEAAGITKYKSAEERGAAQTGIHRAEPAARRRPRPRSEAADRLAPAPGRQGAPLQTDFRRNCSTSTPSSRAISSTCCRPRLPSGRPPPKTCATKLKPAPPTCCAARTKSRNCASGFPSWNTRSAAQQQRGLELKGESGPAREPHPIQRGTAARIRDAEYQGDGGHHAGRGAPPRRGGGIAAVPERLTASETALRQHRADAGSRSRRRCEQVEEELRQRQEALRQAQAEAFAAAQDLTRVRNEITALDLQKQGNVVRLEKLSAEKIQLEEERTRLEARLQEFVANVEAEKLNAQTQRGTVEQRQKRLREFQEELQASAAEQDQVLQQQAEKRSRLNVLEQLEGSHEGFSAGPLAALQAVAHGSARWRTASACPTSTSSAIENALGHHLQLVLTEQPESAQQILADLSANKAGRASVAALSLEYTNDKQLAFDGEMAPGSRPRCDSKRTETGPDRSCPGGGRERALGGKTPEGVAGPHVHCVRPGHGHGPDPERPRGLRFRDADRRTAEPPRHLHRRLLNGNGDGKAPASILGRKNQIAELHGELTEVQSSVAEISRQRRAAERADRAAGRACSRRRRSCARRRWPSPRTKASSTRCRIPTGCCTRKSRRWFMRSRAWPRRSRKACRSAAGWRPRLSELEARERAGQEQVAALTARAGKPAPAARRRQRRAHREQGGAGGGGADAAPRSSSSSSRWSSAFAS